MRNAVETSYKKNVTSGADVKRDGAVPHQHTYRIQILQLLKAVLPTSEYSIATQMKGADGGRRNADIVVTNSEMERVVVEVVAHECDRDGSVLEHICRCSTIYSKISGACKLWVIKYPVF